MLPRTFGVGGGIGRGEVAGELDVRTIPEDVTVFPGPPALAATQFDPVLLVRGALASPGLGAELVVPRVSAALARVCRNK